MSTLALFNRIQLESELFHLQSKYAQEKEDFYKELQKVRETFLFWLRAFTRPCLVETVSENRPAQSVTCEVGALICLCLCA